MLSPAEWKELAEILKNPPKLPDWLLKAIHEKRASSPVTAGDLRRIGVKVPDEIPNVAEVTDFDGEVQGEKTGFRAVRFNAMFWWDE